MHAYLCNANRLFIFILIFCFYGKSTHTHTHVDAWNANEMKPSTRSKWNRRRPWNWPSTRNEMKPSTRTKWNRPDAHEMKPSTRLKWDRRRARNETVSIRTKWNRPDFTNEMKPSRLYERNEYRRQRPGAGVEGVEDGSQQHRGEAEAPEASGDGELVSFLSKLTKCVLVFFLSFLLCSACLIFIYIPDRFTHDNLPYSLLLWHFFLLSWHVWCRLSPLVSLSGVIRRA